MWHRCYTAHGVRVCIRRGIPGPIWRNGFLPRWWRDLASWVIFLDVSFALWWGLVNLCVQEDRMFIHDASIWSLLKLGWLILFDCYLILLMYWLFDIFILVLWLSYRVLVLIILYLGWYFVHRLFDLVLFVLIFFFPFISPQTSLFNHSPFSYTPTLSQYWQ